MPILSIPPNATPIPAPANLRRAVPAQYHIEAFDMRDGTEMQMYAIIKVRHVDFRLTEDDLLLSDDALKSRVVDPCLRVLETSNA